MIDREEFFRLLERPRHTKQWNEFLRSAPAYEVVNYLMNTKEITLSGWGEYDTVEAMVQVWRLQNCSD
jgi:hypothetical protein